MTHFVSSVKELAALGVRFLAVTQGIDADDNSAGGRLLMDIIYQLIRSAARRRDRHRAEHRQEAVARHTSKLHEWCSQPSRREPYPNACAPLFRHFPVFSKVRLMPNPDLHVEISANHPVTGAVWFRAAA